MAVIVVARDSGLFDGAVHSLDLPVCPWMLNLGRPVLDAVFAAGSTKYVCASDVKTRSTMTPPHMLSNVL